MRWGGHIRAFKVDKGPEMQNAVNRLVLFFHQYVLIHTLFACLQRTFKKQYGRHNLMLFSWTCVCCIPSIDSNWISVGSGAGEGMDHTSYRGNNALTQSKSVFVSSWTSIGYWILEQCSVRQDNKIIDEVGLRWYSTLAKHRNSSQARKVEWENCPWYSRSSQTGPPWH